MSAFNLIYKAYGKRAILIEWPSEIDINILNDVILFKNNILQNSTKEVVDVINTYSSITITYQNTINIIYDAVLELKSLYQQGFLLESIKNNQWEIPVCYDKKFGLDLAAFQSENNLIAEEIISLHSAPTYTVFFIGFLPGFLYLGELDEKLHIPRKANPRLRVEKGAVAIGGSQTGIYPSNSAGGWHIIGNSPLSFFNNTNEAPCFAKSGDEIKFIPVDLDTYYRIQSEVASDNFEIKKSDI